MTNHKPIAVSVSLAVLLGCSVHAQLQLVAKAQTATELVSPMLNQMRSTAVTSDGRLWTLTLVDDGLQAGEASYSLNVNASADNGKNWTIATKMRVPGSIRGSLTTGNDGRTLHIVSRS